MSNQERTVMFQLPSVLAGSLACVEGSVKGRSFELSAGTFVIGRLESSDLHLPNEPGVSKTHAKIVAEGDRYVLVDCESRNGTIVNGAPVQRRVLQDGDEIRVCGCVLRFTQRGSTVTGVTVRNAERSVPRSQPSIDLSVEDAPVDMTDPGGDSISMSLGPPSVPAMPAVSAEALESAPPRAPTHFDMPTFAPPSDSMVAAGAAPAPAQGRTLVAWYAGGLLSVLLFGGSASAVIVRGAEPPPDVAAVGDAGPAGSAADTGKPGEPSAVAAAGADAGAVGGDTAGQAAAADAAKPDADPAVLAAADKAAADKAAEEKRLADEKAAADKAAADKEAAKAAEKAAEEQRLAAEKEKAEADRLAALEQRNERRGRRASSREREEAPSEESGAEASSAGGKQFSATPESGRSETLKTRGGKVKTVEAKDGDTVTKGQVLVTFEEGANESEIFSLKDRIATLEAIDSDEARADLKAARAKLDALTSGGKSAPVLAPMSGVLSGFNVSVGDTLKGNTSVGRVTDGDVPRRVRVRVDRSVRPSRGQSVTLITKSGEKPGTVASSKGGTVVVETGDTPATDVDAVRF